MRDTVQNKTSNADTHNQTTESFETNENNFVCPAFEQLQSIKDKWPALLLHSLQTFALILPTLSVVKDKYINHQYDLRQLRPPSCPSPCWSPPHTSHPGEQRILCAAGRQRNESRNERGVNLFHPLRLSIPLGKASVRQETVLGGTLVNCLNVLQL